MKTFTRGAVGAAALALISAGSAAFAQPAFQNVRGTIEKLDGANLIVKSRDGTSITVKLGEPLTVRGVIKISLSDVKPGSRVGITSLPQAAGGPPKAVEVHIFSEDIRPPEMQTPYDLVPQSTMTNATVNETVAGNDGQTLTVKFKDGETKILVPPGTPIATYVPGKKEELVPGAPVVVRAAKAPDGSFSANAVSVGRDGFVPPM